MKIKLLRDECLSKQKLLLKGVYYVVLKMAAGISIFCEVTSFFVQLSNIIVNAISYLFYFLFLFLQILEREEEKSVSEKLKERGELQSNLY